MRKANSTRCLTVCLLSHHPFVLAEFQRVLSGPHFELQVQRLESTLAPDLRHLTVPRAAGYVVDTNISPAATEALLAGILEQFPTARQLVVAEVFSEANAFSLLRLGAKGLLTFAEARERLPEAVQAVVAGGFWVPRSLLSRFVDTLLQEVRRHRPTAGPADLSRREREVLDVLLENLSNKEIASRLHISERTVKFHVANLLTKFRVRRRSDLILECLQARPPGH